MAEALAIIGLASSIITFIEFGVAIITTTRSIRSSPDGKIPEIRELETRLNTMRLRNKAALERMASKPMSQHELQISQAVVECEKVVAQLKRLVRLRTRRSDARFPNIESAIVFARMVMGRGELDRLIKQLKNQDAQVRKGLKALLQSDRHSELLTELNGIQQQHIDHKIVYDQTMLDLQQQILELSEKVDSNMSTDLFEFHAEVTTLRTKLESMEVEAEKSRAQAQFIKGLYFPEIRRRWDMVVVADGSTNAWLHDSRTSFTRWLRSGSESMFYVSGLPGSGKSTLMKHAVDHPDTQAGLKYWAGSDRLCQANHFFWNQGYPKQKSRTGLLQALCYQILRQIPALVPVVVSSDRLAHEEWTFEELQGLYNHIMQKTTPTEVSFSTKFCFFIDGLDEYEGEKSSIDALVTFISSPRHVKVCISSRPRPEIESRLRDAGLISGGFTISMQDFTRDDMRIYIQKSLRSSDKFVKLEREDHICTEIITQIAKDAQGVWLWVYLVTRDVKLAAEKSEDSRKLYDIVNGFPKQLEEYFKKIIEKIDNNFRQEMARYFLVTIFELQPLPLYAFYLLSQEEMDPNYALRAASSELSYEHVKKVGEEWKTRLKTRCSDLLVVADGPHPVFLIQPVDFLHRTVRDFLRDWFHDDLQKELRVPFVAPISLCRIMLFFLKKQPRRDLASSVHYNRMIGLVDELLYYAREAEIHDDFQSSTESPVAEILDEVDRVNTALMKGATRRGNHWTS